MSKKRFLMIDIGAGTMDLLWCDFSDGLHYKAVVESPSIFLSKKLNTFKGDIVITGCEMGGGDLTREIRSYAHHSDVVISHSASKSLNHDMDKLKRWNIRVLPDDEAESFRMRRDRHSLLLGDLQIERIRNIVESFGVEFGFDAVAVCAQDHGTPPKGISHLDFRHQFFKKRLDEQPFAHSLLFEAETVPVEMNRLRSIAAAAKELPTEEVYVMDSGMAAITGAVHDPMAINQYTVIVLDIATSHTVGALLQDLEIAGLFEYHTKDITLDRLELLIQQLADGSLSHEMVVSEGGHGAYNRKRIGMENVDMIVATGPKRYVAAHSKLPVTWGAPLGDNMMTGTTGLLEALRVKKGLGPISFF